MPENPLAAWLLQQEGSARDPAASNRDPAASNRTATHNAETAPAEPPAPADRDQADRLWDLDPAPPQRSRPRLFLLAAVPWLVVALLALTAWWSAAATSPPAAATRVERPDEFGDEAVTRASTPVEGFAKAADPPAEPSLASASPPAPAAHGHDEAALLRLGALLVRAGLHGPADADGNAGETGERVRYADEAVGTGLERLGDVAVVTVTALILEGGTRGWDRSRTGQYAVALRVSPEGVQALSGPWTLPPPEDPPGREPIPASTDAGLRERAIAALERAGYRQVDDLHLARLQGVTDIVIADVRAMPPGEQALMRQEVWIRDGPRAAVLGRG
jgi:hypothetical protein